MPMHYLFEFWDKIKIDLINREVFLFLDYDGTLTPIAATPDDVVFSNENKLLLERLANAPLCHVAVVSGRAVDDLQQRVGLKNITYVVNHGFEVKGPKINFKSLNAAKINDVLVQIKEEFKKEFNKNKIEGVLIDDKDFTLSIHYRLVDEKDMPYLENLLNKITEPYLVKEKIKIGLGKKVFEIRPPVEWDKGKVVFWLLTEQQFASGNNKIFPIYVGDDLTDEDAFKALEKYGITILVGKPKVSHAQYYLNNTDEVQQFLKEIAKLI